MNRFKYVAVAILLVISGLVSACGGVVNSESSFWGRTWSRLTGQEYTVTLPNTVAEILWVDFTRGGLLNSTIKNTTFKDKQDEYYTLEVKDYDAFQGLVHWLKPGSNEAESWTTSRMYTSKWGGVTNIRLPDDFAELLSVAIKASGGKDITYKDNSGNIKSQEYKDFSPFEGTIVWSTIESNRVEQFFFGRGLSRLTGKPVVIKLPDDFEHMIGVDFTEVRNKTIKNVTYQATDGRYYTLENRDSGVFEGGIEWVISSEKNSGINTRAFSRWGFSPVKINLPPGCTKIISVSVKENGVKDVVYLAADGQVKAKEYKDFGILEGSLKFKIAQ